jgi:hypothetical protein
VGLVIRRLMRRPPDAPLPQVPSGELSKYEAAAAKDIADLED